MRIACVQFAAKLGLVDENILKLDEIIDRHGAMSVDWIVLPELAMTGYNFPSADAIKPFLERAGEGPSARWAKKIASRFNCLVTVGYPELVDSLDSFGSTNLGNHNIERLPAYNSTITVSASGEVVAHYRKSFLYYTDDTWAQEGSGFFSKMLSIGEYEVQNCIGHLYGYQQLQVRNAMDSL